MALPFVCKMDPKFSIEHNFTRQILLVIVQTLPAETFFLPPLFIEQNFIIHFLGCSGWIHVRILIFALNFFIVGAEISYFIFHANVLYVCQLCIPPVIFLLSFLCCSTFHPEKGQWMQKLIICGKIRKFYKKLNIFDFYNYNF